MPETAAFLGRKAQDAIEWFHGIGRLVRKVLAQHPDEKTISLVAISVSQLQKLWDVQLELPLGLEDEERRPGSKRGMARRMADRAIDMIRDAERDAMRCSS